MTTEQYAAQLIPLELLREDPLGSIWRFHSQPPLFNAVVAAVLHGFGHEAVPALQLMMAALGLGASALLTSAVQRVTGSALVAIVSGLALAVLPSTLLYESWLFYAHFEFFALALWSWLIARVGSGEQGTPRRRAFVYIGVTGLCLTLLRSAYHPFWLAVTLAGWILTAWWVAPRTPRARRGAYAGWAALLVALACAWPAKNAAQFGFFGSSSWMGMSLAKIAVFPLPVALRAGWVAEGRVSSFAGQAPFLPIEEYQPLPPAPADLHPVLQLPLNDPRYIDVSARLGHDALWVVRNHPALYLHSVWCAMARFFEPTTMYSAFLDRSLEPIEPYTLAVRALLYPGGSTLPAVALYFLPMMAGLAVWLAALRRRRDLTTALQGWLIGSTLAYAFVVFNGTELGENNRFRYTLLPLVLFGSAWTWAQLRRWKSSVQPQARRDEQAAAQTFSAAKTNSL